MLPIRKVLTQPADTKVKTVSFWLVASNAVTVNLDSESSDYMWASVDQALAMPLYPGTKTFFEKVKAGEINID